MSVAHAQAEIDSVEFSEWLAYSQVDPFGEERADLRAAIIASTVANSVRGKGQRSFTPEDFMPKWGNEQHIGQSVEEMKSKMRAAFGKRIKEQ